MTEREALKLTLEALKQIDEAMPFPVAKLAIMEAEKALAQPEQDEKAFNDGVLEGVMRERAYWLKAQPEQEPVAWMEGESVYWHTNPSLNDWIRANGTPLYTTTPQRTWVGLTDDEIVQCQQGDIYHFYRSIEAKLRSKNT